MFEQLPVLLSRVIPHGRSHGRCGGDGADRYQDCGEVVVWRLATLDAGRRGRVGLFCGVDDGFRTYEGIMCGFGGEYGKVSL